MRKASTKILIPSFLITIAFVFGFVLYVEFFKRSSIEVKTTLKKITTLEDITIVKDKNVSAIVYTNAIRLSNKMPTIQRKEAFISMILPSILISKFKLQKLHDEVLRISKKDRPNSDEKIFLNRLFKKYRTTRVDILLARLTTHPVSVVLAQAAVESGWGSSRFFIKANNIFGVWSFSTKDKRIPALGMRGEKTIYLKRYDSMEESIDDYFRTLGVSKSFKNFRSTRLSTDDPLVLINDLKHYSELREEYVEKLRNVITYNNLDKYDDYRLSPDSFYIKN